jgi:predicted nucleotide-binding protein
LESKSYNAAIKQGKFQPFLGDDIVICSYQFARAKASDIANAGWELAVIDEAHRLSTEKEFRDGFDEIVATPPDMAILDGMVAWTTPGPDLQHPPADYAGRGSAGLRCIRKLLEHERTKDVPVIHYSVLGRDDVGPDAEGLPRNVVFLRKDDRNSALVRLVRSMVVANYLQASPMESVFVVHGHDAEARETAARYIEKLGLRPIVLHEQASKGGTIMEKFEAHSNVAFAVVLLTPDDLGRSGGLGKKLRPRARQNVIFELGYFVAKLGRNRVCALFKNEVEIPSDYGGVVYILMDENGAWRSNLAREMKAAGLHIDFNAVL